MHPVPPCSLYLKSQFLKKMAVFYKKKVVFLKEGFYKPLSSTRLKPVAFPLDIRKLPCPIPVPVILKFSNIFQFLYI